MKMTRIRLVNIIIAAVVVLCVIASYRIGAANRDMDPSSLFSDDSSSSSGTYSIQLPLSVDADLLDSSDFNNFLKLYAAADKGWCVNDDGIRVRAEGRGGQGRSWTCYQFDGSLYPSEDQLVHDGLGTLVNFRGESEIQVKLYSDDRCKYNSLVIVGGRKVCVLIKESSDSPERLYTQEALKEVCRTLESLGDVYKKGGRTVSSMQDIISEGSVSDTHSVSVESNGTSVIVKGYINEGVPGILHVLLYDSSGERLMGSEFSSGEVVAGGAQKYYYFETDYIPIERFITPYRDKDYTKDLLVKLLFTPNPPERVILTMATDIRDAAN